MALGAPLLVRLLVPAWIVNATPLPISAAVVFMRRPQPSPAPADDGGPSPSLHESTPLMKAAAAMTNMKVFETGYKFK